MPRITKVYTRKGDDGTTGLGDGRRADKDSPRLAAIGAVDELNAAIGVALATGLASSLQEPLRRIQNDLFHLGADLCVPEDGKPQTPGPRIESRHVEMIESWIDELAAGLPPLANFILPGGGVGAASIHFARTIARRAERKIVALRRQEEVGVFVVPYVNRLSDLLFVMARYENRDQGYDDVLWESRA